MKNIKLILIGLFACAFYQAQIPISQAEAYQKALDNNLQIKDGSLKINAQKALTNSGFSLDPTDIETQYGQFNSGYNDMQLSISQSFHFPGFYKKQKQLEIEKWKKVQLDLVFKKWQLKQQIDLLFNDLYYYDAKIVLLKRADSLYQSYDAKAKLRLEKGESNILEKATAENSSVQVRVQLLEVEKDKGLALKKVDFLINDGKNYTNEDRAYSLLNLDLKNTKTFENHPGVLAVEQEGNVQKAMTAKIESTKVPTLNVGYNNMSIRGADGNKGFNDFGKRFQSVLFGVSIPLFNPVRKQELEAQKINESIADNDRMVAIQTLKSQYRGLMIEYESALETFQLLNNTGVKNADIILKTANLQFINGEIDYLNYVLLLNQALDIQNKNIDSLKKLNEIIITINTLQEN